MSSLYVVGRGLVDPDQPVIHADDLGVLRGDGLFETLRVCGGRPVLLAEHLARMDRGADRVGLAVPTAADWTDAATSAIAHFGAADAVLKLLCTRGPDGGAPVAYALVSAVPPETVRGREEGVHAVTLTLGVAPGARAAAGWLLAGVKTTSYAVSMATLREAHSRGFDDAIWLAADGGVLEAPTANVAWVNGSTLVTPPAEEVGVLRGTTLDALMARAGLVDVTLDVRPAHADELRGADEAFLASSVRGVAPVLSVDGAPIGGGDVGQTTAALRSAYEDLCAGRLT